MTSTKNSKFNKILFDFKFVQLGNCGIGSDIRTTLQALCKNKNLHIDLLTYPRNLGNGAFRIRNKDDADQQIKALSCALDLDSPFRRFPFIQFISKNFRIFWMIKELCYSKFEVKKINRYIFNDILNRYLFKNGELAQRLKHSAVLVVNYSLTKLLIHHFIRAYFPRFRDNAKIDTSEYDFFIVQWWNPFQVSDNTCVVIRYHDSMPITNFDTTPVRRFYFFKLVKRFPGNAFFVCNSEPTRAKLCQILPQVKNTSFVVPCAVSDLYKKIEDISRLKSILLLYWSAFSLDNCSSIDVRRIKSRILQGKMTGYIFFVSGLVPHKNLISLIKAWHPLFVKHGLKLVVCGADPNFKEKDIINHMAPLVESGALIHLERVPLQDMPVLYSCAKALVSPSYSEGFGLPVVEAMRCECPVIISDIEEYRWVAGDAALYFDPYNINEIRARIHELLFEKNSTALRKKLIASGIQRSKRYSIESVSKNWIDVLGKIKRIKESVKN